MRRVLRSHTLRFCTSLFAIACAYIVLPTASAHAAITATLSGPATAAPGEEIEYTVSVTNNATSPVTQIRLAFHTGGSAGLFSQTTFLGSDKYNCSIAGISYCSFFALGPGQTEVVKLRFKVKTTASCGSEIIGLVDIQGANGQQLTWTNSFRTVVTCVVNADLEILKTGPGNVTRPGTITYQLSVHNKGPGTAANVVVTDPIPSGLTYNSGASDAACTQQGSNIVCNFGSMPANQTRNFVLVFTVPTQGNSCSATTVQNRASVTTTSTDNVQGNNQSVNVVTQINCPTPTTADLSVTKTGPSTATRGGTITYTVKATNAGPATANNVVIADTIPTGLTFNSAQSSPDCIQVGDKVKCMNFNLTSGQSKSFVIVFNVPQVDSCSPTVFRNTAIVMLPQGEVSDPNPNNNTSTTVETSVQCPIPDLTIVKSGGASVTRGGKVTYTITLRNTGNTSHPQVYFHDEFPAGFTFLPGESTAGCVLINGIVVCEVGTMQPGQVSVSTVVFEVPTIAQCTQTTVQNKATIAFGGPQPDANLNNNVSTVSTTVHCPTPTTADISVTKAGPASVVRGGTISYTVNVTNSGPATAQNVVVTDAIPSGLTYNSGSSDASCYLNGSNITCNIGALTSGQSKSLTIAFNTAAQTNCSQTTVQNTATVTTSTSDPSQGNNTSQTVTTTITCPTPTTTDLAITKTGPSAITRGGTITYTLTVTNNGPASAQNVSVNDAIPGGGLTYNSAQSDASCTLQGNNVVCNLGTMTNGQVKTLSLVFNVPNQDNCASVAVNNHATVTSQTGETNAGNNTSQTVTTSINCPTPTVADVTITKTGASTVTRGGTLTYTLAVKNEGPASATNVIVTDAIPSGLTYNAGASDASCYQNGSNITCNVGTLADDQVKTLLLVFNVPTQNNCSQTTVQNTATVSTSTTESSTSNNTSQTVSTTILCQTSNTTDVTITKTGASTVTRGSTLTYTLTVNSSGPATAQNVVITDPIPAGLTYNSSSSDPSCYLNGNNVTCNIGSLTSGQSKTLNLVFSVPTQTTCSQATVTNQASVATATSETNSSNNTSQTVTTTITCQSDQNGCIEILKETFDVNGAVISSVTQFTFSLDGQRTVVNDYQGRARFDNVSVGTHTVTETIPSGWSQLSVTPSNGVVQVTQGTCVGITFKNRQTSLSTTDLEISKTDGRTEVEPGERLIYTISVRNTTSTEARNVVVTDTLPDQVEVINIGTNGNRNGRTISWSGLTVPANQTINLTVEVEVDEDADDGDILTNVAQVASRTATDRTDVVEEEDDEEGRISVEKSARTEAQPGDEVLYTITIRNSGDTALEDVEVEDTFNEDDLEIIDARDDGDISDDSVRWDIGTLGARQSRTLQYRARVSTSLSHGDTVRNTVRVETRDDSDSDTHELRIIDQLPQTGGRDFASSLREARSFLTPWSGGSSESGGGAVAAIVWTVIFTAGIVGGGVLGNRYFL
ncbi:MAG: hypothetical protein Q7R81_04375 [Candidatus Peregrinibacteria bacterium]|nr:hypothetical protein [Candidatus Peregrinibacteria bacterium]